MRLTRTCGRLANLLRRLSAASEELGTVPSVSLGRYLGEKGGTHDFRLSSQRQFLPMLQLANLRNDRLHTQFLFCVLKLKRRQFHHGRQFLKEKVIDRN